jgi:hypothetical protein
VYSVDFTEEDLLNTIAIKWLRLFYEAVYIQNFLVDSLYSVKSLF